MLSSCEIGITLLLTPEVIITSMSCSLALLGDISFIPTYFHTYFSPSVLFYLYQITLLMMIVELW